MKIVLAGAFLLANAWHITGELRFFQVTVSIGNMLHNRLKVEQVGHIFHSFCKKCTEKN